MTLALVFSEIAAAGVLIAGKVASRLPEKTLRMAFAGLVLVTAAVVFWRSWA
ncbi:MAG: hypothetical protein Q8Q59_16190 [Luteolibacter sp.]|nr:hypothetical protein [Luteolibacter sp.]